LPELGRILARSYQLLAQLTSVKTMLLLRRERLQLGEIAGALRQTSGALDAILVTGDLQVWTPRSNESQRAELEQLSDPFESDLTPWMQRRLGLLTEIATQLAQDAAPIARQGAAT
jgi:hypothetical protein